jgi:hypothetical protein
MATDKSLTVTEWLERFNDLEAYIADGGRLLDLPVTSLDTVPAEIVQRMVKQMTRERLKRFGRLRERIENRQAPDAESTEQPAEQQPPAASEKTRAA